MTQMPPASFNPGMKPHRATMVLVLGILGIVLCFIPGIIAFILGGKDLEEMKNGTMDPSGMSLTKAGRICGIIGTILQVGGFLLWLVLVILIGVAGGAAAAAGAGGP